MMKYLVVVLCLVFSSHCHSQDVEIRSTLQYDSLHVAKSSDSISVIKYFVKGKRVAQAGYKINHFHETPFTVGYLDADSSFTLFQGMDYDYFLYEKDTIEHYHFDADRNVLSYGKRIRNGIDLMVGDYYVEENHYKTKFDAAKSTYKIGAWEYRDPNTGAVWTLDYDKALEDGEEIAFDESILDYLNFAENELRKVYGDEFYDENVKINYDKTKVNSGKYSSPNFPSGGKILESGEKKIKGMDITFDVLLKGKRYSVIQLRIDSTKSIAIEPTYERYMKKRISRAFDHRNNGRFHDNLLDWLEVVKLEKIQTDNPKFTTYFKWENCGEGCQLFFYIKGLHDDEDFAKNKRVKKVRIDPWSGKILVNGEEKYTHGSLTEIKE